MRFSKLVAVASLTGALVLVAGCDNSTPTVDPTTPAPATSASQAPEPSPTPTARATPDVDEFDATVPPARPEALDGPPSEETAKDAATYFMLLSPYVFATGDFEEWKALSGKSCNYCAATVEYVEEDRAAGKRRTGSRLEIRSAQAVPTFEVDDQFIVGITMKEHEGQVLRADGTVEEVVDYVLDMRVELLATWTGSGWSIDGVDVKWSEKE
ncbi:DUF6318 family protein [Cellulomonas palmilytica]|uniref:DUF6318 family protein n=1 Tax=Cellulomonas palmilytica TaxID=2608402 RepID=UPI001F35364D|nr:DUF6318 family protein [Cellulomonas palmilytica]UJP40365.1 hypothetical protein F1D97_02185 [Cellulomonas palmilytica]